MRHGTSEGLSTVHVVHETDHTRAHTDARTRARGAESRSCACFEFFYTDVGVGRTAAGSCRAAKWAGERCCMCCRVLYNRVHCRIRIVRHPYAASGRDPFLHVRHSPVMHLPRTGGCVPSIAIEQYLGARRCVGGTYEAHDRPRRGWPILSRAVAYTITYVHQRRPVLERISRSLCGALNTQQDSTVSVYVHTRPLRSAHTHTSASAYPVRTSAIAVQTPAQKIIMENDDGKTGKKKEKAK